VRYLGIDTSVAKIPWAVFEDKRLIGYGAIPIIQPNTKKGIYSEDRLHDVYQKVSALIKDNNVDVVILEDVFLGKGMHAMRENIQALAVMRLASYINKATTFVVLATSWRKGIIESERKNGNGVKMQAIDYVNKTYGLALKYSTSKTKTEDDIAEAIIMTEGLAWKRYSPEKIKIYSR
jgi:Holliday junction resolvasome RuvABC endonuclease subunit